MACSGCDARRAWIKRKAKLAAQALAAVLRQEQKPDPMTAAECMAIVAKDIAALPMSITTSEDRGNK